jgi:energy-coupling factor transporter ATP-binding protein EcfA2
VLSVRDLRVRYPGAAIDALTGVTFDLAPGEVVGLVGASGAGKSTLCRSLDGIVPQLVEAAVSGSIVVDGVDVLATPVRRLASLVGIVLDEPDALISQGTAGEEVALGLESLGVPYEEMVARVASALDRVGLSGIASRDPWTLSGGEQQRLVLAGAIVVRPRVLVLDEPTSGLDPRSRDEILLLLRGLAGEGTAVLVVDHDTELLAEHASRILALAEGRLIADGSPSTVLTDVEAMRAAGVRVPAVTQVAAEVGWLAPATPLPVTLDEAVRALGGRP